MTKAAVVLLTLALGAGALVLATRNAPAAGTPAVDVQLPGPVTPRAMPAERCVCGSTRLEDVITCKTSTGPDGQVRSARGEFGVRRCLDCDLHHEPAVARCELCTLPCRDDGELAAHMLEHPAAQVTSAPTSQPAPPGCAEPDTCYRFDCGRTFLVAEGEDSDEARERHLREVHPGHRCGKCELDLAAAEALEAHALWHRSRAYRPCPTACRRCAASGTVRPETTVAGYFACSACGERN